MTQSSQQVPAVIASAEHRRITQAILDFVSHVPDSHIDSGANPAAAAQHLSIRAAQRAALTAGSLALPPGPLGWLTLLPELLAIWKIQGQLVSDIAAAYGRHATLGREQMMWCLFRHTAAQAFRDLVVRMGDRLIFRRMSYGIAQSVARQIGARLGRRMVGNGVTRWLPVVGALGVGAYAYYDTGQVASTAIELFEGEITTEGDDPSKPKRQAKPRRRVVDSLVDKAVAGATRKIANAARKAAADTPRKPEAD